jgi:predicted GNAT family acetyltransferase
MPPRVTRHLTPKAFLEVARHLLSEREVEYGLMLAIVSAWTRRGEFPSGSRVYLATVDGTSGPDAGALMTVPNNVIVTNASAGAVTALAEDLGHAELQVSGVHAPTKTAEAFAGVWNRTRGISGRLAKTLRIHELTRVIAVPSTPGRFRQAQEAELEQLATWFEALWTETGSGLAGQTGMKVARHNFGAGWLFVWDHAGPVSMASAAGPTPNGIRVNGVYTPPEHRGRGYATACVAALSARLLAEGRRFCFLFTDAANPTSNAIYQRIGYAPVAEVQEYRFEQIPPDSAD